MDMAGKGNRRRVRELGLGDGSGFPLLADEDDIYNET
jgi:hypothetical protein